jgi:NAD(P)-dependent dehydrogenase (short-subunit alcohol dehydrogenase family)
MPRTYLITGASGIGAETAKLLAEDAAMREIRLFLVALDEATCESLASDLKAGGAEAAYVVGDLTIPSVAVEVVSSCIKHFGRIDGLFNVAGGSGRRFGDGAIHECTEEGWSRTLEENATTCYRMCREVVNVMLRQPPSEIGERGVILNMSSILAIHPEPTHFDTVAYAASKGAILSMSRTMAASYAHSKIRVNVVAPALVSTAMSARASQDPVISEFIKRKQPLLGGMMPAADVASVCKFLLTDGSRAMTGKIVEVDAGWSINVPATV